MSQAATAEAPRLQATPSMCHYCFYVLLQTVNLPPTISFRVQKPDYLSDLPSLSVQSPLFVTWEKCRSSDRYSLRGCIGSLTPKPLRSALEQYAILSSTQDRRFDPITWGEVYDLRVAVSLLVHYEECADCFDWTVGIHGITIRWNAYSATYLPEVMVEQKWSQQQAIKSLVRKAGYKGTVTPELLRSLQCTRYQSSKCRVTFREFLRECGDGLHDEIPQVKCTVS